MFISTQFPYRYDGHKWRVEDTSRRRRLAKTQGDYWVLQKFSEETYGVMSAVDQTVPCWRRIVL